MMTTSNVIVPSILVSSETHMLFMGLGVRIRCYSSKDVYMCCSVADRERKSKRGSVRIGMP